MVADDASQPRIGYRHRTGSGWSTLHIISPDSLDWGANSPNVFLQERASGDTVHVTYNHGAGTADSLYHTRKAVLDSESAWESATMVTPTIGSTPNLRVDGAGRVHFLGRHNFLPADSTYFLHFRGFPPGGSGSWTYDSTIVSKHFNGAPPPQGLGEPDDPPSFLTASGESTGVFYWLWAEDSTSSGDREQLVFFSRGDSTGSWTSRITLTEHDGTSSFFPTGALSDSMFHVVYSEPTRPPGYGVEPSSTHHQRLYHRYSRTPLNASSWSRPMDVVPEQRTFSIRPSMFAVGDTLFVLYVSHDDDHPTPESDGDYEVWARKGFAIADTLESANVTWTGAVYLDAGFEVQAGKTLTIEAGTRIFVAASSGPEKFHFVIRGTVVAEGTAEEPIVFTSYDGDSTAGEWGSLVFDLAASPAGYGYAYTCASTLRHVRIENGEAGIRVLDTGAPSLDEVAFENIEDDRHIVLDGSDVYVPYDGGWTLPAGTRVKVRPHGAGQPEIAGRNPGLVDLVGHGPFVVEGVEGDSVHFEPEGAHPDDMAQGRAWGGIFVDWFSTGNSIVYADIGYAPTPLTLMFQDMPVEHSRLHDFANEGLRVQGIGWTQGPRIRWNLVERGSVDDLAGRDGMVFVECADGEVLGNEIRLTGTPANAAGGAGIRIIGGKTYCLSTSTHTLWVDTNLIIGPGGDHDPPGNPLKWSGIYGDWMCGAGDRDVLFTENVIEGWNGAGITLLQTKDVQFTCNEVRDCFHGVDFSRNTDVTGPPARFRANVLKVGAYGSLNPDQDVARTDNSPKLALGPGTSDKGSNQLVADGADWFLRENDDTTAALNTASSYWKRNGVHYVQADTATIRTFFTTDLADPVIVDVSNALEILPDLCGASAMQAPRDDLAQTDRPEDAPPTEAPHASDLPDRTDLTIVRSAGRGVEIRFALSGREERAVVVEVFNVAGRRVETVLSRRLGGGRYGVSWSGTAGDGSRVGAGVYLIRMRAGDETRVRKAALVR